MTLRSRMIVLIGTTLTLAMATTLNAQPDDDLSPTIVAPKSSFDLSPYVPAATPPDETPEGVTTYLWPEIASLPRVETASLPKAPTAMYAPQQTVLRPLPATTVQYAPGGQCVCTPSGQSTQAAPLHYTAQPPYATSSSPAYAYRPTLPVSQLPPDYYFGRGLIGQPKVYVAGQPVRNALRFVTP